MDAKQPHSSDYLENPEVLHEESDVNVRGIVGFGLGLVLRLRLRLGSAYRRLGYRAPRRQHNRQDARGNLPIAGAPF